MIVTVTMNPAIDKTVEIEELKPGNLNRIERVEYDAGGKGINVSKTIHELGGESIAAGFLGGNSGKTIEAVLNSKNIKNDFIWVEGETRTNTKIYEKNGRVTELNEKGPSISSRKIENLLCKLDTYAGADTLFVLAGSVPGTVETEIYARIIERVHAKGAKVLLDADGALFRSGLKARPDMIKPNEWEIRQYAGLSCQASEEELLSIARNFQKEGIKDVVISMGKKGALFILGDYEAKGLPLSVNAHSTVGAGDAMVAAMAYAWDKKLDKEDLIRLCMGSSAGAVTTVGTKPPAREMVDQLMEQVVIERRR